MDIGAIWSWFCAGTLRAVIFSRAWSVGALLGAAPDDKSAAGSASWPSWAVLSLAAMISMSPSRGANSCGAAVSLTNPSPLPDCEASGAALGSSAVDAPWTLLVASGSLFSFWSRRAGSDWIALAAAPLVALSSRAITSPIAALSPGFFRTSTNVPDSGAFNSTVALSVSSSNSVSFLVTLSPWALTHSPISTWLIDSPTLGTLISMRMASPQLGVQERRFSFPSTCLIKGRGQKLRLLLRVSSCRTGSWARRRGTGQRRKCPALEQPRAKLLR